MKATVNWLHDDIFIGQSESGHLISLDADQGKTAPSPLENMLLSLGSCASVDVVTILKKAKQRITGCKVILTAERVDTIPKLFKTIHLQFYINGHDINDKHVSRAVSLSTDKYCSVIKMLEATVNISHSYQITADES